MTDNSKIEINPSVLQNRSQTYQSLTDVNGADVFTDDYEEKVKDYQQKEQRSYEDTKEQVFIKKMDENAGKEERNRIKGKIYLHDLPGSHDLFKSCGEDRKADHRGH